VKHQQLHEELEPRRDTWVSFLFMQQFGTQKEMNTARQLCVDFGNWIRDFNMEKTQSKLANKNAKTDSELLLIEMYVSQTRTIKFWKLQTISK